MRLFLCFIFFFAPLFSFAAVPKATYYYSNNFMMGSGPVRPTPSDACQASIKHNGYTMKFWVEADVNRCYSVDLQGNLAIGYNINAVYTCPENSTASGSECTCNSGFNEENGQCVAPSPCDGLAASCTAMKNSGLPVGYEFEGKVNIMGVSCVTSPLPSHAQCSKGCGVEAVSGGMTGYKDGKPTMTYVDVYPSASTCDLPPLVPDAQPGEPGHKWPEKMPIDCAGDWGQVNGVDVCMPSSGAEGDHKKTEEKKPDGSTTQTETSTKCEKGQCTTTTTTTNKDPQGNPTGGGGSSSTTTSKSDYCQKNPKSRVCAALDGGKNPDGVEDGKDDEGKGSFGGSCGGGWTCEGDAAMCAIAKKQHETACKMLDEDKPDSTYAGAVNGSDGKNTTAMKAEAGSVNIQNFDKSGFGWGSSCPADPSIPLGFIDASFEIPFSRICGPLGVLSLAGVGITLLGSILWVLGGRKQG